jgi:hypothetical protein
MVCLGQECPSLPLTTVDVLMVCETVAGEGDEESFDGGPSRSEDEMLGVSNELSRGGRFLRGRTGSSFDRHQVGADDECLGYSRHSIAQELYRDRGP